MRKVARVSIVRCAGGPSGGRSLGHGSPVPEEERWHKSLAEVENQICVGLGGRAAHLEFLGGAYTGAADDLRQVRGRLRYLAEEGYYSSAGCSQEPTENLTKEIDELVDQPMERTRQTLRLHAGKVEALVAELLEREELNEEEVAEILGERPPREQEQEPEPQSEVTVEGMQV